MAEIVEEFFSGFCRTSNETRTVECEYEKNTDGTWRLVEFGCNYEKCPNNAGCLIYQQARDREKQV